MLIVEKERVGEIPVLHMAKQENWNKKRNAAKDRVVPYRNAHELYELLLPVYEHSNDKLSFILDERAEHKVNREGVLKTAEWFEKHLGPYDGQNA